MKAYWAATRKAAKWKMDREEAVLKLIAVFRKGRDIDETKLAQFLLRFPKKPKAGIERTFDEKEYQQDPAEIEQLDAMTAEELEVLQDCIANFEGYLSKEMTRHMS